MLTLYPSRIPDPGVKKAPDPGSGSATLRESSFHHWLTGIWEFQLLNFKLLQSPAKVRVRTFCGHVVLIGLPEALCDLRGIWRLIDGSLHAGLTRDGELPKWQIIHNTRR
jgi:hypothetical protein